MKILYATMQLGRGYGQGTERYVALLAAGMRARGHEAVCIAGDPERRGPHTPLGTAVDGDSLLLAYPTRSWMAVRGVSPLRLAALLAKIKPDVVHIANPAHIGVGLISAARAAGIPVIVTVMDFWWLCPKHTLQHYERGVCDAQVTARECLRCIAAGSARGWTRALARTPMISPMALPLLYFGRATLAGVGLTEMFRWVRRQTYLASALSAANAVIFPSQTARRLVEPRLRGPTLHSIPYGLEPRWFATAARLARGREDAVGPAATRLPIVGYAGALAEHKGVHLLLDALRRLSWADVPVRVAGGGDAAYEDRLRALATGLNVQFAGRVPTAEMPEFLAELDLMVAPSTWLENLPIVVLEAQALGVPVLASRVDGIAEMIPSAEQLFDIGSAESLAERLAVWRAGRIRCQPAVVSSAAEMIERTAMVYQELHARSAARETTAPR